MSSPTSLLQLQQLQQLQTLQQLLQQTQAQQQIQQQTQQLQQSGANVATQLQLNNNDQVSGRKLASKIHVAPFRSLRAWQGPHSSKK